MNAGSQCRTTGCGRRSQNAAAAAATLLTLSTLALAADWPPFLPPRERFPTDVVTTVERVWREPTLARSVDGPPAAVPFQVYVAFLDTPEVTAAAARYLRLADYEVRVLDEDWYEADDHDGARGVYRILARPPARRVILSWGEHRGPLLGTIRGSALTVLDFAERDGAVSQSLAAYVRIDNRAAAALARVLVTVFGWLADRKLAEGFTVTAKVAEWSLREPDEFCQWLARGPFAPERRERVAAALPGCR